MVYSSLLIVHALCRGCTQYPVHLKCCNINVVCIIVRVEYTLGVVICPLCFKKAQTFPTGFIFYIFLSFPELLSALLLRPITLALYCDYIFSVCSVHVYLLCRIHYVF